MKFGSVSSLWGLVLQYVSPPVNAKADVQAFDPSIEQVAVIGAGLAGSSAAYHIRKFAEQDGIVVNVTLFEKTAHIGGRTLTVNPYDDPAEYVELGASIFVEINHILWKASHDFNLTLKPAGLGEPDGLLAVWDGSSFVYQQDESAWGWWNLAKLLWKYGMTPYHLRNLVRETIAKFLKMYEAPLFPWRSLSTVAYETGLTYVTGQTGEQFLAQNKIGEKFAHDVVQASTRVNYASNLARIHGLEAMVAMAPEGAVQVAGGNWLIPHNMVKRSGAWPQLNTSVATIDFADKDNKRSKYKLTTKSNNEGAAADAAEYPVSFNKVVVATPYQFANILAGDSVFQHAIDEIPYVKLHVTLFASPFQLSPVFFNLPPGSKVPTTVLTTLGKDDVPDSGSQGAGSAGFFSISTLRTITNPNTAGLEYLYKVFSPQKWSPMDMSRILGVEVPKTFTGRIVKDGQRVEPVSWFYAHVFHSYPRPLPRITFQDPILGDGLYYTSGIESFISTMETSALSGMNAARLVVDDIQEEGKVGDESAMKKGEDGRQKPFGAESMEEL